MFSSTTSGYKSGMTDHTKPSNETRQADEASAGTEHKPDRMPTNEEEQATQGKKPSSSTAEHYKEMAEKGANQKGEGRVP